MLTLNDGRNELWQWDTGRKLTVDADCSQVHFSNKVFGRSVDVDVVDGVAIIPDILLQTDKDLNVWAFVGTPENGYTKISKVFKVNWRNKPADYVFTPPEQTTLGKIMERLDEIEESQDPDAIKNAVDDYLSNNPIEIDETDPTVPEWAKQPTKPSYTASEVGALPADTVIPTIPDNVSAFRNDAGYLTEHQDLTGYATERYVQGYAQPKGDYLTEVPDAYATKEFVTNKIAEAELGGEEVDLSGYAQKSELPTKVSQLENDKVYLTEHQDISGKLDASALPTAINTALAQAKASGEFDGKDGVDGQPGKDGYTPQKNVDYFDGQPGKDGSDGSPGKDGTSATHSWNGTVLTVTSASGTSSANLKGEKGDKGDKGDSIKGDTGSAGADGVSPTVAVSKSGKVTTISITDKNGTKTATVNDGADGASGSNGKDGTSVTVKSVSESTADGGSNVVTFSDGKTVTIKNGSKGSKGDTGSTGATGKTPVKGTDYWTAADQEAIVQQVIAALGTPVFGRVDADNNIILTGELADGTYTVKYEDAGGNVVEVGIIVNAKYNNLADPASQYWLTEKRLNSSDTLKDFAGSHITNFIPCKVGDVIRVKGLNIRNYGSGDSDLSFVRFYSTENGSVLLKTATYQNDNFVNSGDMWTYTVAEGVSGSVDSIAFIRFNGMLYSGYTKEDVIITVNQEIE